MAKDPNSKSQPKFNAGLNIPAHVLVIAVYLYMGVHQKVPDTLDEKMGKPPNIFNSSPWSKLGALNGMGADLFLDFFSFFF